LLACGLDGDAQAVIPAVTWKPAAATCCRAGQIAAESSSGWSAGVAVRERGRTLAIVAEWWSIEVLHGEVPPSGGSSSMTQP